jgi:hypothetical protein
MPQQFSGDSSGRGTHPNELVDPRTPRQKSPSLQPLYSAPSEDGTQVKADTSSVEDVVMTAHDHNTGSDDMALPSDGYKRTTKSNKSKQKRPPDTIFQGPAKRARTSAVTCVSPVVSLVSDNLHNHTNDKGETVFPLIFRISYQKSRRRSRIRFSNM